MKSNRQRRSEIIQHRAQKRRATEATKIAEQRREQLARGVSVNPANLKPTNSYGTPDFVSREYYIDKPFKCKDCGKDEIWTATQQKWWYEVAHGDVWTTATRCRACRRKEAARKAAARKVHLEGVAQRKASKEAR